MPQSSDSRIPSCRGGSSTPQVPDHQVPDAAAKGKKSTIQEKSVPAQKVTPSSQRTVSTISSRAGTSLEHRGIFHELPWEWQLAGLIAAIVSGLALFSISLLPEYREFLVPLLLSGLALSALSFYSAIETNWLRDVERAPLAVKVGAGTSVVSGLIPIGGALALAAYYVIIFVIGFVIGILMGLALVAFAILIVAAVLGSK